MSRMAEWVRKYVPSEGDLRQLPLRFRVFPHKYRPFDDLLDRDEFVQWFLTWASEDPDRLSSAWTTRWVSARDTRPLMDAVLCTRPSALTSAQRAAFEAFVTVIPDEPWPEQWAQCLIEWHSLDASIATRLLHTTVLRTDSTPILFLVAFHHAGVFELAQKVDQVLRAVTELPPKTALGLMRLIEPAHVDAILDYEGGRGLVQRMLDGLVQGIPTPVSVVTWIDALWSFRADVNQVWHVYRCVVPQVRDSRSGSAFLKPIWSRIMCDTIRESVQPLAVHLRWMLGELVLHCARFPNMKVNGCLFVETWLANWVNLFDEHENAPLEARDAVVLPEVRSDWLFTLSGLMDEWLAAQYVHAASTKELLRTYFRVLFKCHPGVLRLGSALYNVRQVVARWPVWSVYRYAHLYLRTVMNENLDLALRLDMLEIALLVPELRTWSGLPDDFFDEYTGHLILRRASCEKRVDVLTAERLSLPMSDAVDTQIHEERLKGEVRRILPRLAVLTECPS